MVALQSGPLAKKLLSAALPRAAPTSMMLVYCLCLWSASRRPIGLSSGQTLPHVAIATRGSTAAPFFVACIIPVILPLLPRAGAADLVDRSC